MKLRAMLRNCDYILAGTVIKQQYYDETKDTQINRLIDRYLSNPGFDEAIKLIKHNELMVYYFTESCHGGLYVRKQESTNSADVTAPAESDALQQAEKVPTIVDHTDDGWNYGDDIASSDEQWIKELTADDDTIVIKDLKTELAAATSDTAAADVNPIKLDKSDSTVNDENEAFLSGQAELPLETDFDMSTKIDAIRPFAANDRLESTANFAQESEEESVQKIGTEPVTDFTQKIDEETTMDATADIETETPISFPSQADEFKKSFTQEIDMEPAANFTQEVDSALEVEAEPTVDFSHEIDEDPSAESDIAFGAQREPARKIEPEANHPLGRRTEPRLDREWEPEFKAEPQFDQFDHHSESTKQAHESQQQNQQQSHLRSEHQSHEQNSDQIQPFAEEKPMEEVVFHNEVQNVENSTPTTVSSEVTKRRSYPNVVQTLMIDLHTMDKELQRYRKQLASGAPNDAQLRSWIRTLEKAIEEFAAAIDLLEQDV